MRNITNLDDGPEYADAELEWLVDAWELFSILVQLTSDTTLYDLGPGHPCRWDRADGTTITHPARRAVKIAEHLGYLEPKVARLNERVEIDIFVPTEKGRRLAEHREGRLPSIDEFVWVVVVEPLGGRPDYFLYFGGRAPEHEDVTGVSLAGGVSRTNGPSRSWRVPPRMLGLTTKQITTLEHAPLSHSELRRQAHSG